MGLICCGCCFQKFSAKTNEFILIFGDIVALFLLFMCFYMIKWKEISMINLVLFIAMLLIIILCLVFTFMLRCWRSSGAIKTTKREAGIKIVTAGFILSIINLIICGLEEIIIIISFGKIMNCGVDTENDLYSSYFRRRLNNRGKDITELNDSLECEEKRKAKNKEYYISYLTLSYLELILIFSICIFSILKERIINKVDDNLPSVIAAVSPYGRQVIIVHPGNEGMMGIQNYNNYNNNYDFNYHSQNMNFGKKKNNPNSNQYVNPQNVNVVSSKIKNQNYSSSKDKSYSSSRNFE